MKFSPLILIPFFVLNILFCNSQDSQLDSLKNILSSAKEDTNKLAILNVLIESINEDEIWSKYNDQLGPLAQKLMLGNKEAVKKTARKHYATYLNNKGYLFHNLGDITQALDYFHQSLKVQEELGDKMGLAYSLNNLGVIYNNQGDLVRALEYYEKSLKIREQINDKRGIAQSLSNIGTALEKRGDRSQALRYFYKSLRIRESIGDKFGQGYSLESIGTLYLYIDNPSKAVEFFNQSLKIRREINDKQGQAYSLFHLGQVYLKQNQPKEALKYGLASLELSNKLGFPANISAAANLLHKIYQKEKKFDKAYDMLTLYHQMEDSVNNSEIKKITDRKRMQYEFEKREVVAKAEQEKREITYNNQIKQNRVIIIAVALCLIIVFLFSLFLYRRIKIIQKQKQIIESQKTEVDKQREIAINRSIVAENQKEIIELHQKEIVDSINYAKRIQYAVLANEALLNSIPDHFVLFAPKDIVSGDFYWATTVVRSSGLVVRSKAHEVNKDLKTPNTKLRNSELFYLAVCDSTGHGVPGAFMSLLNISFLNEAINEKNLIKPNEIFNHVRSQLINTISKEGGQDGMDGTLMSIDKVNKVITYAAANNSPIVVSEGKLIQYPTDKMPVGKGELTEDFRLFTLPYKEGDIIYLLTDGYADQFGGPKARQNGFSFGQGKKFKYKQLQNLILSVSSLSLEKQKEKLEEEFQNWKGNLEQVDDVCLIGIRL